MFFPDKEVSPGIFKPSVLALVGDDSDYHRVRRGYMKHTSAVLLKSDGKTWVLSRGTAWGDYPVDPYDSHILAIEVIPDGKSTEKFMSEICGKIRGSWCFSNSVIGVRRYEDSFFVSEDNELGKKMWETLAPERTAKFTIRKRKANKYSVHTHKWSSIMGPLSIKYPDYERHVRYKRKIVKYLTNEIIKLL